MTSRLAALTIVLALVSGAASAQWVWTPETGRFVRMKNLPKETPELQVEYTRSLLVEGDYDKAFEETNKFDEFYPDSTYADENQFLRGQIRLGQKKYVDAADEFQKVVTQYPESDRYDEVIEKEYEIADMLFDKGKQRAEKRKKGFRPWQSARAINPFRRKPLKHAIDVYTMVIQNQPFTPEAAKAQYKIGQAHFEREEYLEASFEFRRVIEDYPNSEWVKEASYELTRSYQEMALPPDYDQAPSQLAIDTIQEFKRRFPDDPRIEEREEVEQDMRERIAQQRLSTAEYYERRAEPFSARIYYQIAAYEFSGTEASEKARAWLDDHPPRQDLRSRFVGPAVVREQ